MLIKSDLSQIKKVVGDELKGFATKDDLGDFVTKRGLKRELAPIKSDLVNIRRDIKTVVKFF